MHKTTFSELDIEVTTGRPGLPVAIGQYYLGWEVETSVDRK
jgi:hypothetical protein